MLLLKWSSNSIFNKEYLWHIHFKTKGNYRRTGCEVKSKLIYKNWIWKLAQLWFMHTNLPVLTLPILTQGSQPSPSKNQQSKPSTFIVDIWCLKLYLQGQMSFWDGIQTHQNSNAMFCKYSKIKKSCICCSRLFLLIVVYSCNLCQQKASCACWSDMFCISKRLIVVLDEIARSAAQQNV